jgi:hypothetical protein
MGIVTLFLFNMMTTPAHGSEGDIPYIYGSRDDAPRYFSFVTDNPKFNEMWTESLVEFLSRQLENGQLIESMVESKLYMNAFPRSVTPLILIKSGYYREARRYLDFMWENQKKDGSFWNYYDMRGVGGGKVEEDGGCYVVAQTYMYSLYSGDHEYLKVRWGKIRKAMGYLEELFNGDLNLVFSTAGYSEGNIAGGYNIYHQAVSVFAFRSAAGIAELLGKRKDAQRYTEYEEKIKEGLFENLFYDEGGRFSFQRRPDGSFFDPPYPAFLMLSYYDIIDPSESAFERSFEYMIEGPRYGEYSEEIFGLEPFDHEHATGRGFWFGQNGHGWVIPYLLKAGRLDEADRWIRSLVSSTDNRTYLVPEHINWGEWDPDGGEWAGVKYGILPDSSAWVDPGNLYALSTAMHMVFNIIETDPADERQVVHIRVPSSFGMVSVTNLKANKGYLDAAFVRKNGSVDVSISGRGEGRLVIVGAEGDLEVSRDGVLYELWSRDAIGNTHITTDFHPHKFTIQSGGGG